jgi:hypothetical protein
VSTLIDTALPETEYHAHPALSTSGAKRLLHCPAIFKHERDHGRPHKQAFDFGHVAHGLVLGVGQCVHVIDAYDRRTKAAQQAEKDARARGDVPVLRPEWLAAVRLARAVQRHHIAGPLFATGQPEVSVVWTDETWGIQRRARFDWLTSYYDPSRGRQRALIVDLKTAVSADPKAFGRKAYDFGYDIQDTFYRDAAIAAGIDDDPAFLFVVVEKQAPHIVQVAELDAEARRVGRARTDRALEVFRDCTASGIWPGYSNEIEPISLPRYAAYDIEVYA